LTPDDRRDRHSEDVRAYFGESSGYWDRVYRTATVIAQIYRRRQSRVLVLFDRVATPTSTALDVGAGAGHLAVAIARRGLDVVAVDNSDDMVRRTREQAAAAGVQGSLRAVASDAECLELPDGLFDVVIGVGVLPWVERPERALAEMVRVAKPRGHIILTLDNARGVARFLDPGWHARPRSLIRAIKSAVLRRPIADDGPWPTSLTWRQVEVLLQSLDLQLLERDGVGFGPFTFLGRKVLPAAIARKFDRRLQALSDGRLPFLRGASLFHLVLVQTPPPSNVQAASPP
jgi:ubiquinone/menaquinone biosynthesis C-methylase UbiE